MTTKGAAMPPDDPTPLGDAMTHRFPEQQIPEPRPLAEGRRGSRGSNAASTDERAADVSERPPLPDHPQRMAADIEDEEADPVIDTGPVIADGMTPPSNQRG
jgi:hypothetical protein